MEKMRGLSSAVLSSDAGLEMRRTYDALMAGMDAFEADLMGEWCGLATAVSAEKLCQPVLRCDAAGAGPVGAELACGCSARPAEGPAPLFCPWPPKPRATPPICHPARAGLSLWPQPLAPPPASA